jgi:hypothetical protein
MPAVPGGRLARPVGRPAAWPPSAGPAGLRRRSPSGTSRSVLLVFPYSRTGPPVGPRLAACLPRITAGSPALQNLMASVTTPQRPDDLARAPWRFGRSFQARSANTRQKNDTPGPRQN